MSRRYDSALGEEDPGAAAPSSSSSTAGPQRLMHELESDGEDDDARAMDAHRARFAAAAGDDEYEEGEEDISIDDDDVDHELSANMQAASLRSPPAVASSVPASSVLQNLPSYRALMASVSQRNGSKGDASPSLSLSPGSAASDAALAASSQQQQQRDSDENMGFLEDELPSVSAAEDGSSSASALNSVSADVDADADDAADPPLTASFESILSRAMTLEKAGRVRRASHLYLLCLERHRYNNAHQQLIATCLARLGDICYRNKKCQWGKQGSNSGRRNVILCADLALS